MQPAQQQQQRGEIRPDRGTSSTQVASPHLGAETPAAGRRTAGPISSPAAAAATAEDGITAEPEAASQRQLPPSLAGVSRSPIGLQTSPVRLEAKASRPYRDLVAMSLVERADLLASTDTSARTTRAPSTEASARLTAPSSSREASARTVLPVASSTRSGASSQSRLLDAAELAAGPDLLQLTLQPPPASHRASDRPATATAMASTAPPSALPRPVMPPLRLSSSRGLLLEPVVGKEPAADGDTRTRSEERPWEVLLDTDRATRHEV